VSDERPAESTPEPTPPAPAPSPPPRAGDAVTEGGYSYTLVEDPHTKASKPAKGTKAKRERQPMRISAPAVAALVIVPAAVVGAAAWFFADRVNDGGGGGSDARTGANVASLLETFSGGQAGRIERIEGGLPQGLPEGLPAYPGANVLSSQVQVTGDDALYLVVYDTPDSIEDVARHFDGALSDDPWQVDVGQDDADSSARQFSQIDDPDIEGQYLIEAADDADVTTIFLIVQVVSGAGDADLADFEPPISKPLPEGFPDGIPAYPDGIVTETIFSRAPDGNTFGLTIITRDSVESALDFYREDFQGKGWTVTDSDAEGSGIENASAIAFESDDASSTGSIAAGDFADDRNYTQIALQVRVVEQDDD
jgi:hypothetical protein